MNIVLFVSLLDSHPCCLLLLPERVKSRTYSGDPTGFIHGVCVQGGGDWDLPPQNITASDSLKLSREALHVVVR